MWIDEIANNDCIIDGIVVNSLGYFISIKMWNGATKQIQFNSCWGIKEKNGINEEIGNILVKKTNLYQEIAQDVIAGGGSELELDKVKDIVFYDAWNERIILEILAEDITW